MRSQGPPRRSVHNDGHSEGGERAPGSRGRLTLELSEELVGKIREAVLMHFELRG